VLLDSSHVSFVNLNPDWVAGADGYYYYTKVIEPGQKVSFCDNVALGSVGPEYDSTTLAIDVVSEASYITKGSYPHERAWWNVGSGESATTTIETIRATLKGAIDTYVALNWS